MTLNTASHEVTRNMARALNRTQYYPPDRMQAYQRKLLEPLLHHARQKVPFYATRLDPLFDNSDSIRWDAWADIPTFTRGEAQQAGEALFAKSVPDMVGGHTQGQTSGSTGTPLKFRVSEMSSWMNTAAAQRIFDWHELNLSGTMAFLVDTQGRFPYPEGSRGNYWNLTRPEAIGINLSLTETISNQLDWLIRSRPDFLITYPSIAVAICELAALKEVPVPFHTFMAQGEVFGEQSKSYLENEHNIKTIDRYGASEIGAIAAQCPTGNCHHQFCEASLMEVLDLKTNDPLKEGRGRMVLTPFYNYAMPLIRYENQDQIEITRSPCPCGRTLPSISRILGRERHVFTYLDGSQSWPFMLKHEHAPFLPSRQLQTIQKTETDIEIRFVRDTGDNTPVDHAGLQTFLQKRLHPSIQLEIQEVDAIPRAASGKFEEWISLLA
ncbi:MAG: hypothetical protein V7703_05725 [Hyphomicrobiales bacterium]